MLNSKRIRVVVLSLLAALALYALLGFFLVPHAAKQFLVSFVERDLGHKVSVGEVRFNPFTFRAELADVDLREPSGGPMLALRHLLIDFEAASLWRRAWTFADIAAQAPHVHLELRANGRHNFSALLDALHDPKPQPDRPPPQLAIGRIAIEDGRADLADAQAGNTARVTLAPIAFELTELTTEASDTASYKLTARSAEGEQIAWNGEISINPAASRGRLALQGWKVETLVRWLGTRIALDRSAGTVDVAFDYDSAFSGAAPALVVSNFEGRIADLALTNRGANEPFARLGALNLSGGTFDLAARKFGLERIEISRAALALAISPDGSVNWSGAIPQAGAEPAPGPASTPPVPAQTPDATAASNETPWSGRIGALTVVDSAVTYADRRAQFPVELDLSGIRLQSSAEVQHAASGSAINLSGIRTAVAKLAVRSGAQHVEASEAKLDLAAAAMKRDAGGMGLDAKAMEWALGSVTLRQGDDGLQAGSAVAGLESARLLMAADGSARLEAAGASFDADGIGVRIGKAAKEAIEVAKVAVHARTVVLEPAATGPGVRIDGLGGAIHEALVRDPASGNALARLKRAELTGAAASTAKRELTAEKLALTDAHTTLVLAAQGKSNWDALMAAFGDAATAPREAKSAPEASPPWKVAVNALELGDLGVAFTDQRQDPPFSVELQQVSARARNASSDGARPIPVQLNGRIKDSGQFSAAGRVNARTQAADLKVKLTGLSLLPLQPYLARLARVQLVSGLASAEGRVRYGLRKAAGADLVFEGEIGLDKLIVEETEPAQPLLAIETLRAAQTRLTLGPNRLEIPDLRLDKLATRLIIAQDQSVNIAKLLRTPPPASDAAAGKPAPKEAPVKPAAANDAAEDPFPIVISRVRVDNSVLEFADFSLTPNFATRMHELQGVITGISTSADTRARMELDARVDEFGSAQIRGIMNLFKPKVFTNVSLVFRNLEMTNLTPYAAKFAGYRIASGKLSMDLQYRIKNSALVGENKIVIDKLELGERVESPTALDLPLELAIAILKDDQGRIDIGLPVSGSLEDPQFSIAAVVWRAIGNLLGRIVTAPFRAIASMFGGGKDAEELGSIGFDPGAARLAPHERHKLQTVAEALAKRSELKLTINPAYAPEADREALQSAAVRREVLARAGIKLNPGEAPGPLDYGNATIRRAIENVFTDTFGFPAARDLRANLPQRRTPSAASADGAPQAAPVSAPTPSAAPTSRPDAATDAKPADKPPEAANVRVARAMARRLIENHPVDDAALAELAKQRGEAIATALRDSAKVDPARIATAAPRAIKGDTEGAVETTLELGVAK